MNSKYRTKSSVGSGDDERLKKSRYQEKLGEHDVQRERVVTKGKREYQRGKMIAIEEKFRRRRSDGDDGKT